jgi:hypothetical protein
MNAPTGALRFKSDAKATRDYRRFFFFAAFPFTAKSGESSKNRICSSILSGISFVYLPS